MFLLLFVFIYFVTSSILVYFLFSYLVISIVITLGFIVWPIVLYFKKREKILNCVLVSVVVSPMKHGRF